MGEFTEDNDGLVWRAAVLAQGYTDSDIKRAIGFGRLHRIWPGVYASASPDRGLDDLRRLRVIAAVRACDQPMVVSHSSAGLLHGLPLLQPSYRRVHLSTGRAEGGRVEKWRHLHTGALAADEVARVGGLSVTTLERTAVDCAHSMSQIRCRNRWGNRGVGLRAICSLRSLCRCGHRTVVLPFSSHRWRSFVGSPERPGPHLREIRRVGR